MSTARWLAPLLAIGCTAKPSIEEMPMSAAHAENTSNEWRPDWRIGDSWTIHSRVAVPPTRTVTDAPWTWQDAEWEYRVEAIESAGEVRISVQEKGRGARSGQRMMYFNPSGRLRSFENDREPTERLWSGPYFPLDLGWWDGLAYEWPAFPLVVDAEPKWFEDGAIAQSVEQVDEGVRVTLERAGVYEGSRTSKTMEQIWERGRPWWSSMSIRSQNEHEGVMYRGLEIEGKLVRWSRMPTTED